MGPLPDPDTLQQYEAVQAGIAERIVRRFEILTDHRQAIENKIIDAEIARQQAEIAAFLLGQSFAFAIAVIGLLVSGVCIYHASSVGQSWAAASIGGVSLGTLVGVFLYGHKAGSPKKTSDPKPTAKP